MLVGLALLASAPAAAQQQPVPQRAPAPAAPVPDQGTVTKLVWSTMAAVDHGNRTGNYSVLRDLGSPVFQQSANAATLGAAFANMRNRGLDLSSTLMVAPTYDFPPAMIEPGVLRARGTFPMRPTGIAFDLLFQWNGGWTIHNIAIAPVELTAQPDAQPAQPARR